MSYPILNDYNSKKENIILDLSLRKEFNIFKQKKQQYANTILDKKIIQSKKVLLNSYQHFVGNFINPDTPYTRLLLMHGTGTGKTISALNIAQKFINYYNKVDVEMGKIFILGFTKNIFKKELLRPEFGIVTKNELDEFIKVKELVVKNNLERDINYLKELKNKFNKRISKQNIEFYGYKEFVNKLFILNDTDKKLTNLSEKEILQLLKDDIIKLNEPLLQSFKNSLLICDEIHNVYNSAAVNNWGISIQIILDFHSQYGNSLRTLLLSATPLNNNHTEVVNLLNLLSNYDNKIHKSELFNNKNEFLPMSLDIIKNLSLNKISYIRDINTQLYPSSEFIGTKIKNIDYLKFIKCPMSKLHLNTYKNLYKEQMKNNENFTDDDIEFNINKNEFPLSLSLEKIYINDYVVPNPDSSNIGLFKSTDINNLIRNASAEWKEKNKIKFIDNPNLSSNYELSGNFMLKDNIKQYSTKYFKLLELIKQMIIEKKGKIFIYHNFVSNSGVIFIKEMLKVNGYLDINSTSTSNTICTICGNIRKLHEDNPNKFDHQFKPVKFITVHSEISKNIIEDNLDKFNLSSNANGDNIKIIIGSRAIKESYDLKSIRNVIITSCPDNISTLIQIIGRAVRKNSHIDLDKNIRNTDIYILVNAIHNDYSTDINLSYEETKYKNKIDTYKQIQKIEHIFINNSIDSLVNSNIYNTQLNNELFSITSDKKNIEIDNKKLNLSTFIPFHSKNEINIVKYIIKRLFLEISNIWDYDTLFSYTLNPPFNVEMDTTKILEDIFIISLDFLVYKRNNTELVDYSNNIVENLFDTDNKIIVDLYGNKKVITYIDKYYILTPFTPNKLIKTSVDEPFRYNSTIEKTEINIDNYINSIDVMDSYNETKKYIINNYKDYKFEEFITFLYDYDISIHKNLIEDIIKYLYNLYINNIKKDEYHNLYFKLLYYYNKFNLIIFANHLDSDVFDKYYKDIVSHTKIDDSMLIISSLEEELIMSSGDIGKIELLNDRKNSLYKKHLKLYNNYTKNKKVCAELLPVGHIIDNIPKLYNNDKDWFYQDIGYSKNIKFIDNDIIVGYNSKNSNSIDINFKLKPPSKNNNTKIKDSRSIHTGVVCLTKDKKDLLDILNKLEINIDSIKKYSKKEICNLIRRELITKEIQERQKGSNIKYYYTLLE